MLIAAVAFMLRRSRE